MLKESGNWLENDTSVILELPGSPCPRIKTPHQMVVLAHSAAPLGNRNFHVTYTSFGMEVCETMFNIY